MQPSKKSTFLHPYCSLPRVCVKELRRSIFFALPFQDSKQLATLFHHPATECATVLDKFQLKEKQTDIRWEDELGHLFTAFELWPSQEFMPYHMKLKLIWKKKKYFLFRVYLNKMAQYLLRTEVWTENYTQPMKSAICIFLMPFSSTSLWTDSKQCIKIFSAFQCWIEPLQSNLFSHILSKIFLAYLFFIFIFFLLFFFTFFLSPSSFHLIVNPLTHL